MSRKKSKCPSWGSVTEGTVVKWLVEEGEKVEKYQPLAKL